MKIRMGDTVLIIAGKDKGKSGTVLRVLPEKSRVVIEGANMRVRHIKKTAQQPGQRIRYEASLHVSNVMILDPKTKKPTRVGYKIDEKTGGKKRIAKVSGEVIAGTATAKPEKPKAKKRGEKAEEKKGAGKKEETKASEPSTATGPVRQPFWKRAFGSGSAESETGATETRTDDAGRAQVAPVRRSRESS